MNRMNLIFPAAALAFAALAPCVARAGLEWSSESGWVVQGVLAQDVASPGDRAAVIRLLNDADREEAAGNLYSALSRYNEVIDLYPNTDYEAEALFGKGRIHLLRSQFERAFEDYHAILTRHPQFNRFGKAVEGQYAAAMAIRRGERPYLWGWIPWFKDDEKALDYFEKTHAAAPYGVHAEWALYERGTWAREIDKEEEAFDSYERLVYRYPDSFLTPDAYIALAELHAGRVQGAFWDQGSTRESLNFYKDFVALFPSHEYAPKAQAKVVEMRDTLARNRLELGKFYYTRRNNARAAAIFLNETISTSPDSDAAKEARELLEKIKAKERAPFTLGDLLMFGRYPSSDAGDFVDEQSQQNLEKLGFRDGPKTGETTSGGSGQGAFGADK